MNFAALLTLLLVVATPTSALAQTGPLTGAPPSAAHGAVASQPVENGTAAPAPAPAPPASPAGVQVLMPPKAAPVNELRSVLQLQKAHLQKSAQAERLLTAQERTELRQLLRQQREGGSASSASN